MCKKPKSQIEKNPAGNQSISFQGLEHIFWFTCLFCYERYNMNHQNNPVEQDIYVKEGYIFFENLGDNYNIKLEQLDSPRKILEWTVHLSEKAPMTRRHIRRFLKLADKHLKPDFTEETNETVEAASAFLACMIIEPEYIPEAVNALGRNPGLRMDKKIIYDALVELYEDTGTADGLVLAQKLKEECTLDLIGGTEYLRKIIESIPTAKSFRHYVDAWLSRAYD